MNEANTKEANANPNAGSDVKRALDLPFFATPGIFNGMTEQSLARAKENYEKLNAASGAITDVLSEAYSTNARGIADYTAKVIEFSGRQHHLGFRFSQPSPGHEIALGNPAALRHTRPQELRSHDRAKPGALGARPQGSYRDCRANQEEFCQRAAEGVLVVIRTFAARRDRLEQALPTRRAHSSRWRTDVPPIRNPGRNKMGVVMIKCPETGRAIPTGMKADRERFRSSPVFFARTFCSICEASHEWFAREAWVHEPAEERLTATLPCDRRGVVEAVLQFPSMAPFNGPLAAGRSLHGFACAYVLRLPWQTGELEGGDRPPAGRDRAALCSSGKT